MKKVLFSCFILFLISCQTSTQPSAGAQAQPLEPVKWTFTSKHLDANNFELIFTAKIDKGWHVFSQTLPDNAVPLPTTFTFEESKSYTADGKVKEKSTPQTMLDADGTTKLTMFLNEAVFVQKVKVTGKTATVKGKLNYMKCNEKECLPPEDVDFSFTLDVPDGSSITPVKPENNNTSSNNTPGKSALVQNNSPVQSSTTNSTSNTQVSAFHDASDLSDKSLWEILLTGFITGLLSVLTPCVYSMLPLTVNFFTKQSGSRKKGITNSLIYGGSIIFIFAFLGFLLYIFGISGDSINQLASNGIFNFILFLLFLVFAISFFGVFEITLPTSWANKSENIADKGGLLGIFFMALTLVIVSFSCTVPFIGSTLALITSGHALSPIVGMGAYGVGLALPFALFAFFPNFLHSLPKSGGWLNTIKVSFAFVELAIALKFLTVTDLVYHWHLISRDVFLSLWIIIFGLMGFYLLGFIRFIHDSETTHISIPRLFFAILSLSFTLYMVPGLWGAPVKLVSWASPPPSMQEFDLTRNQSSVNFQQGNAIVRNDSSGSAADIIKKKYNDIFHCPLGLNCYFDYNQGLAAAKKQNKPIFLDFTGWSCTNCRKMEASVWPDQRVIKRMLNDYIVISLYTDDPTSLPESEQYVSTASGKKIKSVGNKNYDIEYSKYNKYSQPYYVLIDNNEQVLTQPRAYNEDIDAYVKFLDDGLTEFKKRTAAQSLTSK